MSRESDDRSRAVEGIEIQLTIMARNIELLRRRDVGEDELERASYLMLRAIAVLGETDINGVAAVLGLDPSTAGRQVSALAEEGLVVRAEDAEDRRRSVVSMSEEGRRRLELTAQRRQRRTDRIVEAWSGDDLRHFGALLARYNAAVAERYLER